MWIIRLLSRWDRQLRDWPDDPAPEWSKSEVGVVSFVAGAIVGVAVGLWL